MIAADNLSHFPLLSGPRPLKSKATIIRTGEDVTFAFLVHMPVELHEKALTTIRPRQIMKLDCCSHDLIELRSSKNHVCSVWTHEFDILIQHLWIFNEIKRIGHKILFEICAIPVYRSLSLLYRVSRAGTEAAIALWYNTARVPTVTHDYALDS